MSFFFFQAEDGIRDRTVTGVQTCALPISDDLPVEPEGLGKVRDQQPEMRHDHPQIGRASCRERVQSWVVDGPINKKNHMISLAEEPHQHYREASSQYRIRCWLQSGIRTPT